MINFSNEEYELMALAAGYKLEWFKGFSMVDFVLWNPSLNYKDTFKLMVNAGISVTLRFEKYALAYSTLYNLNRSVKYSEFDDDKLMTEAAAICRCAVGIGKCVMKEAVT